MYSGGANSPLVFQVAYNSAMSYQNGPFGANWRGYYDRAVARSDDNQGVDRFSVYRPDGKSYSYTFSSSTGIWSSDADVNGHLERLIDISGNHIGWRYITDQNETETYNARGHLVSIANQSGITLQLTYSDLNTSASIAQRKGTLIRVTDSFGQSLSFTNDSNGRFTSMMDPNGSTYAFTYDTNYNLSSVTFPGGDVRQYLYENVDFKNALTGIIDENGARYATWSYDTQGRAISSEHAGGAQKITLNYNADGSTTATDAISTSRTYSISTILGVTKTTGQSQPGGSGCSPAASAITYDTNGNVASKTDFNGNTTSYTFDLDRNLELTRTEGTGLRNVNTEWNANWRIARRIAEPLKITTNSFHGDAGVSCAPAGASTALICAKTVQATTDATGAAGFSAVADGAPRVWSYTYNQYGQALTADGPRSDVTDVTTYTYDPQGNVATVTNALGQITTFPQYDASGRLLKSIDPNGLETTLTYTPRGWLASRAVGSVATGYLTTTYTYDGVGQLKTVTLPDLSTLTYDYDGAHRLIRITDTLGNKIDYTLDNIGNRISETSTDPQGALVKAHTRQYDALNRLFKDIGGANPLTQITTLGYDANGNPTSTTDALARVTTQSYDALNRLTQVIDPFNGAAKPTKYTYNAQDQLTQVTDPKGLATAYTYNGLGELLTQASPDTGITSFTYDAAGNLKTKTDARNITATYSYDELNRVISISYPATGSDAAETVTYSYDTCSNGIGRLCTLSDKTGTTSYTYDLYGRISAKSQTVGSLTQTMSYAYNSAGQLASITTPSGKNVTYTYQNNQPVAVAVNGRAILDQGVYQPFGPISGWRWGNSTPAAPNFHVRVYDKDYRASSVTSDRVGAGNLTRNYTWSDVSTLSALTDPASAVNSFTYGYDSLDRLTNAVAAGVTPATFGYSYDGDGNRLTQTTGPNTTTYTYPTANNRLASLSGATAKTYQYDSVGNLTSDGTHTWNYGGNNRPTQVSNAIAIATQFQINALGQRVKKSSAGTDQRFVYDEAGRLWGEYDSSGNLITETIWFNDLPVAVLK